MMLQDPKKRGGKILKKPQPKKGTVKLRYTTRQQAGDAPDRSEVTSVSGSSRRSDVTSVSDSSDPKRKRKGQDGRRKTSEPVATFVIPASIPSGGGANGEDNTQR